MINNCGGGRGLRTEKRKLKLEKGGRVTKTSD